MATIAQIAAFLQDSPSVRSIDVRRDGELNEASPLSDSSDRSITFATRAAAWTPRPVGLLIAPVDLDPGEIGDDVSAVAYSERPRLDFVRTVTAFFGSERPQGIDATAVIDSGASVDDSAFVGPGCTIGSSVIGAGTVVHPGVHIYDGVTIGARCTIHAGTVIGADGFGYAVDEQGTPQKFPHTGSIIIGDDVEIGSNASIDRATMGATRIGDRVKIDNLVHVGHNVRIAPDTMIAAGAMIGGSTQVGRRCWIGPQAAISNGLRLGDDVFVTLGSVVTRDVSDGQKVTGNFAIPHDRFLRHLRDTR